MNTDKRYVYFKLSDKAYAANQASRRPLPCTPNTLYEICDIDTTGQRHSACTRRTKTGRSIFILLGKSGCAHLRKPHVPASTYWILANKATVARMIKEGNVA
jgi:hypothetical protein